MERVLVGFVYNEPCPLKCDFCCHTKENVGPGKLTPENTAPIIKNFSNIKAVNRFAFTGGDPFVYIKDIKSIMRVARESGVTQPFHIVTSGYWAKTDIVVEDHIKELKALGLDMLFVSYDVEHSKWVSPEKIYRIENACERHGVLLSVYGVFWEEGVEVRDLLPHLRTDHVNRSFVAPIGRAREQVWRVRTDLPEDSKYSCGRSMRYEITIYPNGEAYPCCSGGFNKEAKLLLGNAFEDSAETIIRSCLSNFHVRIAKHVGFNKLYDKIQKEGLDLVGLPSFEDVASVCQVCSAIHGNNEIREKLADIYNKMEVEYCTDRFATLTAEQQETQ